MSTTESLNTRRVLTLVLGIPAALFFICGVIATIISSQIIFEKIASRGWNQTIGVVENVSFGNYDGATYVNYVNAHFVVSGKQYTLQESLAAGRYSQALYKQGLAEGDPITVYYDPKNPAKHALIDREIDSALAVTGLVSVLLLTIPGLLLSYALTLTSPLTFAGRLIYAVRILATFLLVTSTLVIGMDQTSWLVFFIPAVVILLLIVWGPNLIRQMRGTR